MATLWCPRGCAAGFSANPEPLAPAERAATSTGGPLAGAEGLSCFGRRAGSGSGALVFHGRAGAPLQERGPERRLLPAQGRRALRRRYRRGWRLLWGRGSPPAGRPFSRPLAAEKGLGRGVQLKGCTAARKPSPALPAGWHSALVGFLKVSSPWRMVERFRVSACPVITSSSWGCNEHRRPAFRQLLAQPESRTRCRLSRLRRCPTCAGAAQISKLVDRTPESPVKRWSSRERATWPHRQARGRVAGNAKY